MLPGDISAELVAVIGAAVARGDLPPAAATAGAAGTWRPAPDGAPGTFANSLPFRLGGAGGRPAAGGRPGGPAPGRVSAGHRRGLPDRHRHPRRPGAGGRAGGP